MPFLHRTQKIISGGQTGADIGALVAARRLGIETGGFSPRGFRTEKGSQEEVLKIFGLIMHPSPHYKDRTRENIRIADATLILATHPDSDGTRLTVSTCMELDKPHLVVDPWCMEAKQIIQTFLSQYQPTTLNVAGNRESVSPGIAGESARTIFGALS